jgi:hypothetical protein
MGGNGLYESKSETSNDKMSKLNIEELKMWNQYLI